MTLSHPGEGDTVRGLAAALLTAFADSAPLRAGAAVVGDPIAVLLVLYHLLWTSELAVDMQRPLRKESLITAVSVS